MVSLRIFYRTFVVIGMLAQLGCLFPKEESNGPQRLDDVSQKRLSDLERELKEQKGKTATNEGALNELKNQISSDAGKKDTAPLDENKVSEILGNYLKVGKYKTGEEISAMIPSIEKLSSGLTNLRALTERVNRLAQLKKPVKPKEKNLRPLPKVISLENFSVEIKVDDSLLSENPSEEGRTQGKLKKLLDEITKKDKREGVFRPRTTLFGTLEIIDFESSTATSSKSVRLSSIHGRIETDKASLASEKDLEIPVHFELTPMEEVRFSVDQFFRSGGRVEGITSRLRIDLGDGDVEELEASLTPAAGEPIDGVDEPIGLIGTVKRKDQSTTIATFKLYTELESLIDRTPIVLVPWPPGESQ